MKKRLLSTLLALCMVLSLLPAWALAEEAEASYYDPSDGGTETAPESSTLVDNDATAWTDEGYAAEGEVEFPNVTVSDAAVEEVQALLDALPGAEDAAAMDPDAQREAYDQTQAAYDAYLELTEEQRGLIAGAGVFEELFAFFNGQIMPLANGSWEGNGTSGDPYLIEDAADLEQLASKVNSGSYDSSNQYFKLAGDIDLGRAPWTPIGSSNPFKGTFDGGNHTISGLSINSSSQYVGLFGQVSAGKIQNLNVSGDVTGSQNVGGVVGRTESNATVTNCSFSGTVTGSEYVGGVVGYLSDSSGKMSKCHNSGKVVANITSSFNCGAGGVVGYNTAVTGGGVEYCYNTGEVTSPYTVGGVVGYNAGPVQYCYNTGEVTVTGSSGRGAGGVAGYTSKEMTECYNTGKVIAGAGAGSPTLGGVAGSSSANAVTSCAYLRGTADTGTGSGTGSSIALYACQFAVESSFSYKGAIGMTGWSFQGEPYAQWQMGKDASGGNVRPILLAYPESDDPLAKLACTCVAVDGVCTDCGIEDCACESAVTAEHTITISQMANGTVTASTNSAAAGTAVTLTVTPGTGYKLKSLTVTADSDGTPVEVSPAVTDSQLEYTFDMPDSDVTVTAEFEHNHVWNTWGHNDTHHWHECTGDGVCDITADSGKNGYAAHTPGDWIVDREPTVDTAGSKHKECTTCEYPMETEEISKLDPSHNHAWATAWTTNETHHWHECTAEGCGVTADSGKNGYAAHTPGDWIVDREPTVDTAGSKHKECTTCEYTMETEEISKLDPTHTHAWDTAWTTNETHHWHECTAEGCGITADSGKNGYNPHTPGDWIIDREPTVDTAGSRHKACTVCGYTTETETIPKLEPSHTHAWASVWTSNEIYHWHECTAEGCGITADSGKNGYGRHSTDWQTTKTGHSQQCNVCRWTSVEAEHIWDNGRATANSRIYTCTICGATREERVFTVSGYAYEKQNNGNDKTKRVKDATVQLMRGNVKYGETTTDSNGNFSFANVEAGVYNITAEKKEFAVTKLLVIDGNASGVINVELEIPNNKTKTKVVVADTDVQGNAAASVIAVDGLDNYAEFEAAQGGQDAAVSITMTVEAKANTDAEIASDIKDIEAVAKTGQTLEFLVLTVEKQVNEEKPQQMEQTNNLLTVVLAFDMTNKEDVAVYRKHGGKVLPLEKAGSRVDSSDPGNDGKFWPDEENGFIYIYTQKFSTYAIGYTKKDDSSGGDDGGGGNNNDDNKKPDNTDKPSTPGSVGSGDSGGSKPSVKPNATSTTPTAPSTPMPSSIFSDVPSNHTFATEIAWARDNGIMGGYSDGTFRPNNYTNRQQMWMVLARMAGANPANMAEARTWAINVGVSDGTNPENPMSRQQMVAMLYRFAQSQGVTISGSTDLSAYPDNGVVASYATEALAWAVGNGIVTGTTDGRLNPEGTATRAHFAAFLYRYNSL